MITTLFGFKDRQTRQYTENGTQIPVTHIVVGPSIVTKVTDTTSRKSYQLGIGEAKKLNKSQDGAMKKAGIEKKPRFLREVAVEALLPELTVGGEVLASQVFQVGDTVQVTGISKGKGFAGGPRTHGQSDKHRAPGSIGSGTTPGRVYRGKRMAGRMGNDTVTVKGLKVVAVDPEKHIVVVKGAVPGHKHGLVKIAKQG